MNQNNQQFIKAAVVIVIIAGLLGALSVMAEGIGMAGGKIFAISLSLIFFGITATISMAVTRKPEYKTLGYTGMTTSGITFLLIFFMIIAETGGNEMLKIAFCLFIASIGLAHICLLHYFNLQNKYASYARMTGTIAIALFSIILITRIFEPLPSLYTLTYSQNALKILIAALIIDLAATLLVPLCNRLKVEEPAELIFTPEPPPPPGEQNPVV